MSQLSVPVFSPTILEYSATDDRSPKLQHLISVLQQSSRQTPTEIQQLVQNADLSPIDLMPWADFSHPVTDGYGRKLVYNGGHFEIMVMSWLPGDFSAIHDHGSMQWGAVQCFGFAEHYTYTFTKGLLRADRALPYTPGLVQAVDQALIHQMGNTTSEPFLSLHVYGCPKPQRSITGNAQIFDLLEGSIQFTDGGVFFGLPEAQINKRTFGIRGDRTSTLRHHRQMSDRLRRITEQQKRPDLEEKLSVLQALLV